MAEDLPTKISLCYVHDFEDIGYCESQNKSIIHAKAIRYNDLARLNDLVQKNKDWFTPEFVYHVKFLEELERDSLQSQQDYENGTADFLDKVREGE